VVVEAGHAQAEPVSDAVHGRLFDPDLQDRVGDRRGIDAGGPASSTPAGRARSCGPGYCHHKG
jgi:hypothetical protein